MTMKLITHNAYWFQGHPSRWGSEKVAAVPEVLDALTRLYASAGADLLCLQEVHRADLAETVARDLRMPEWLHAPGGLRPDYGGVVASRSPARLQDRTRPDDHPPHERVHLRASLEWNGEPLEIAAVHLPSNRFASSRDAGDAARIAELRRVLDGTDRPHLIAGDMNCPPGSPPYQFLMEAGYVDAAAAVGGDAMRRHRVDYIWLDRERADRLAEFAALDTGPFCRTAPDGAAWHLSDHPPLLMELR